MLNAKTILVFALVCCLGPSIASSQSSDQLPESSDIASAIREHTEKNMPSPWGSFKDYFTGLAILLTSLVAVYYTLTHNQFQEDHSRKEAIANLRLRALDAHQAFWEGKAFQEARKLISVEAEYSKIEELLKQRTKDIKCLVGEQKDGKSDYDVLENIDGFYAAIMRLIRLQKTLATFGGDDGSENMIRDCYGYWLDILRRPPGKPGNRDALVAYLRQYWLDTADFLPAVCDYGATKLRTNKTMDLSGGPTASG
ncbi:MAG: hypothetical protein NTU79_04425 [Planctomycetota bacterium]|nr:hypothetical protein [Planctomycetota bacterium]